MIDLARITYDWEGTGEPPSAGDYLRGQGVRGPSPRAYLVHAARPVKSKVHAGRLVLSVERLRAADIPAGAAVYPIRWYSRASKRSKARFLP